MTTKEQMQAAAAKSAARRKPAPQNRKPASGARRGTQASAAQVQKQDKQSKLTQSAMAAAQSAAKSAKAAAKSAAAAARQMAKKGRKAAPAEETGKLKVIPLGGLNEIGKNMTVFEYGDDIIVVDAGLTFPDDTLPGVDSVIPDITYLAKNRSKIRGLFITHGHEDHIGAVPYVLRDLDMPIYCTALTGGIIRQKLEEHKDIRKADIRVHKAGDRIKAGVFEVELIHINHSIADAVAFAIRTPLGTVVVTGDYKIDSTPIAGDMLDLGRFAEIGREGVLLSMGDSTNAERPGFAMSERQVGQTLEKLFDGCDRRIIVAAFASNLHRVQQVITIAAKHGRKVAVSGRSMETILRVATELGYLDMPKGTLIDIANIKRYPKEKLCIITTGSQGEPMSALHRMAYSTHRQVEVGPEDRIIISASPIPGNEKSVYSMINELCRKGADVIYKGLAEVHVSGHACQEEIKMMIQLLRPKYMMPAHGEFRHLMIHAQLGRQCGVDPNNIFLSENGRVLEITAKGAKLAGTVPSGRVLVDGLGVGDVGTAVLRERMQLSDSGLILAVATIDRQTGHVLAGPEVITRGFVFAKESGDLLAEMRTMTAGILEDIADKKGFDRTQARNKVRDGLSDYLYKKIKRSPVILPVFMEI